MVVRRLKLMVVLLAGFISQLCAAQEITVAAAADLQSAMQDVAARFPNGNRQDSEADLRIIREFLPADPERCSL